MYYHIYQLFPVPVPADGWATEYDFSEHPDAFPIARRIGTEEDRSNAIAHFGTWLAEQQLGHLNNEMFTIDAKAADLYFEGRFTAFQQAVTALQVLNETQFIHDHDRVRDLIDQLGEIFAAKYGDYVLLDDTLIPMEEFLRKASPGAPYYLGAVFIYKN